MTLLPDPCGGLAGVTTGCLGALKCPTKALLSTASLSGLYAFVFLHSIVGQIQGTIYHRPLILSSVQEEGTKRKTRNC